MGGAKLWTDRSMLHLGQPAYFLGYSNGKSAARVTPGLHPNGVHRWSGQPGRCQYMDSAAAHVLHFANCGEDGFVEKHQRLITCTSAYVREMPFYKQVVDALKNGDDDMSRKLYRNLVVLSAVDVDCQLALGTCFRCSPATAVGHEVHGLQLQSHCNGTLHATSFSDASCPKDYDLSSLD